MYSVAYNYRYAYAYPLLTELNQQQLDENTSKRSTEHKSKTYS